MDWLILGLLLFMCVLILFDPTYSQLMALKKEHEDFKQGIVTALSLMSSGYLEHGIKEVECLRAMEAHIKSLEKRLIELERKGCVRT